MLTTACPPPTTLSDECLLTRAAAGERSALDSLFHRHRAVAYRVAHRLLGNEADALDAVQDGFVKVLTHMNGFQGRSTFRTWLLRVVSNAALDLGRVRGRRNLGRRELDDPELLPEGPLVWDDVTLGLEREELRGLLDAALTQLPDAQRQTFVLHVDGDLSYREVADVLGISIGTVMSRLFYARQKLRSILAPLVTP